MTHTTRTDSRAAESWRAVAIVLVLAAILRLGAILFAADLSPETSHIWEFGRQARCALRHNTDLCFHYPDGSPGFYPSALMPPLASYAWLALFKTVGDTELARAIWLACGVAISLANIVLLYVLARRLGLTRNIALIAAAILAIYPTFVLVAATHHLTNLTLFLLLGALLASHAAATSPRPWRAWLLLGAIGGLAILNRTEMLLVAPALTAMSGWKARSIVRPALALLVTALVIAPWTARNAILFHRFVPSAQSDGYNLWKGFNPLATGSGNLMETSGTAGYATREAFYRTIPAGETYEVRQQAAFRAAARDFIETAGIQRLLSLTAAKAAMLLAFDWTDPITRRPAYLLPWLLANGLALLGLARMLRDRTLVKDRFLAAQVLVVAALMSAALMATGIHARYRMHFEPFLFIAAAIGFDWLRRALAPKRPISR